jgi:hypothetical protein
MGCWHDAGTTLVQDESFRLPKRVSSVAQYEGNEDICGYPKTTISPKQDVANQIIHCQSHVCFIAFAEFGCTIDELGESLAVEIDSIDESYIHFFELRGVDNGHKVF